MALTHGQGAFPLDSPLVTSDSLRLDIRYGRDTDQVLKTVMVGWFFQSPTPRGDGRFASMRRLQQMSGL